MGGNPDLVGDVAIWAVPAGIIGGRIYFDITTPADIPQTGRGSSPSGPAASASGAASRPGRRPGIWRVRRSGASAGGSRNAIAPALLVAQAVGRIGNYFNQELFGKPSGLPWALEISHAHRPGRRTWPYSTFQPSFLYELIFDLALAAALVWLGHHRRIRPWGLFALYVAGYSAYRIFEETIRIDSSEHFLGLRLNFYVATIVTLIGHRLVHPGPARARGTPGTGPGRLGPLARPAPQCRARRRDRDSADPAGRPGQRRCASRDERQRAVAGPPRRQSQDGGHDRDRVNDRGLHRGRRQAGVRLGAGLAGWARSGKSEELAVAALADYLPRYAPIAERAGLTPPAGALAITERHDGLAKNADFGSLGEIAPSETRPLSVREAPGWPRCSRRPGPPSTRSPRRRLRSCARARAAAGATPARSSSTSSVPR